MLVKIVNKSKHPLPAYATEMSAGMDLRADINGPVTIKPMERIMIPTNLSIELPIGYEAQVRPRSGLSFKHGITLINSIGTIDADYRGCIGIPLINLSTEDFVINDGERVAQLVVSKHETVEWKPVENLSDTERGTGGFGHTGK